MKLRLALAAAVAAVAALLVPATAGASSAASHRCTATWNWKVNRSTVTRAQWSETEWTGNTCGYAMQDRSLCYNLFDNFFYTKKSGIVRGIYIWDRATCTPGDIITKGELSINGGPWFVYWKK